MSTITLIGGPSIRRKRTARRNAVAIVLARSRFEHQHGNVGVALKLGVIADGLHQVRRAPHLTGAAKEAVFLKLAKHFHAEAA